MHVLFLVYLDKRNSNNRNNTEKEKRLQLRSVNYVGCVDEGYWKQAFTLSHECQCEKEKENKKRREKEVYSDTLYSDYTN